MRVFRGICRIQTLVGVRRRGGGRAGFKVRSQDLLGGDE